MLYSHNNGIKFEGKVVFQPLEVTVQIHLAEAISKRYEMTVRWVRGHGDYEDYSAFGETVSAAFRNLLAHHPEILTGITLTMGV